ncbi:Vacuolar membrane antiporter with Ca2+/H+ and K+/H+ exchange [Lithohypha guttulata]|uniref:Vacuolar calcium ion transporter n=1 Tax=Lithohypha guttulata TaxID=1690604 RepID=A0AAN7YBN2_9EURO|nr:Vacuolar membrane antiporter with Ca2+/H+ and K+/H+ exchange [Lithohypha guttulata]KAK5087045.1 Vacuolar membrane antiporter with Ca2+/H+ and K+/H+ exchange [Lithohypha guttulata]KAK5099891.1 Vacuolar membrane antiporter with Ca2+/H+ and K+/H+ exchange [Lithohypha guttulata]
MSGTAQGLKGAMRKASMSRPTAHNDVENGPNGTANPNERSALLNHVDQHVQRITRTSSGTPYDKHPNPAVRYPALVTSTIWKVLKTNYVNVLLVFVPIGIIAGACDWDPVLQFVLNFIAIIPLASLLAFATEELAIPLGQTIGGLLNATFGNAVELIVSIIALRNGEIRIVQSSMLGSILSNILLVLGCCFFAGGLRYREQSFNSTVASTMSSLMAVATASLIIPATLYSVMDDGDHEEGKISILSHGTSIILLVIYVAYLFFQLKTHADLFEEPEGEQEDQGGPEVLGPWAAGAALVLVTILVSVCADYLVDSIDAIVEKAHISKTFIGLILIPIVGNAAEHVTAVIVAYKNKMDLAIGVAIGSSLQIAIFVTPFLVILGWMMGQPMTLHFETFETVSFFLASLVVILLIQDGKSNYLEGLLCLGMYFIIALAFYVLPDNAKTSDLGSLFGGH